MQLTLFQNPTVMNDYERVQFTDKYIDIFNRLYENQVDTLYNHSPIFPFSYLNRGRLELYVNKDVCDTKIIPIVKKFKTTPSYFLYSPIARYKEIMEVIEGLDKISKSNVIITDVTERYKDDFLKNPGWKAVKTSADVIYSAEIVANIKGAKFSSIRNTLKKVRLNLKPEIRELSKDTRDDAIHVFEQWKLTQGLKYFRVTVGRDIRLIEEYYDKVDFVNFFGYVIYVDDKPCAVSFGCRSINDKEFGVEVTLKALTQYNGLSDFARQHLITKMYENGIKYVNDSGLYGPGIKNNKTKWKPINYVNTYNLIREEVK